MIPIGLNLTSMGVTSAWWLDAARQAEQVGLLGRLVLGPLDQPRQEGRRPCSSAGRR